MPTIEDAQRLAERYAAAESLQTGKACRGFVAEFAHGWAVWTALPAGEVPPIGTGSKTVLDRETGELTHWTSAPLHVIAYQYAATQSVRRPQRITNPLPASTIALAANLALIRSPDGRVWRQNSALDDSVPEHHPLVAQWLADQPSGPVVRGAQRHAELLVISEALHDNDPVGILDPAGRVPCATCTAAGVHFGLLDPKMLAFHAPQPGELAHGSSTLADGRPFDPARWAQIAFEIIDKPPMEAARSAIERYPIAISERRGPGQVNWIRPFQLGVTESLKRHETLLYAFGVLMGTALYPLGEMEGGAPIVIGERGQVFVLDEGGGWYCGPDIDTALTTLTTGSLMLRVRSNGLIEEP